jgi:hypothetical protein
MIAAILLATACTTTNSYSHTAGATGAYSQTWIHKVKCGRNYTETEHRVGRTARGTVSDERASKVEKYPHWQRHEWLQTITARGTVTVKVTNTSG